MKQYKKFNWTLNPMAKTWCSL